MFAHRFRFAVFSAPLFTLLLCSWSPAWAGEASISSRHSDLERWIADIYHYPIWYEKDIAAHDLWLYVTVHAMDKYSDDEIDKIAKLLHNDDDVVVYWSAYSLYAIGPAARRAAVALQQVEHEKECYFNLNPDELTVQNLPDTLKSVMAKLGVTPLPEHCELFNGGLPPPPPPPPHPDLHRLVEAIRTLSPAKDTRLRLYDYVSDGLSTRFSKSEIDDIASLLELPNGDTSYEAVWSLEIIGPDARRAAPILRRVTLRWECYFKAHPAQSTKQTIRYPLEELMALLSIERLPIKCEPDAADAVKH